jgi:hypothetical protein
MEFSGLSLVGVFLTRFNAEVGRAAPRPPDHPASHSPRYA